MSDGTVGEVELDVHDRTCDWRVPQSAFRWHLCPKCGRNIDTFGGNVS